MPVTVIHEDARFQIELSTAGNKLVVVDFTASWCGPCQRIAPVFEELSNKYTLAVFLKVDVDQCPDTAASQGVTAMPTFIFFRSKVKLAQIQGADPQALENKIKELVGSDTDDSEGVVPGHVDLFSFIAKSSCECLNESDENTLTECLSPGDGFLESDVDEQLIMSFGFNQTVKLHSLKIQAPKDSGPKNIKLFINHPRTLDFDQADSMEPVQAIEIQPKDLDDGVIIPLRYVKFQHVQNLQIFVKDNQEGTERTRIDHLTIYGSPICTTNMGEFKRVAGKKGESH